MTKHLHKHLKNRWQEPTNENKTRPSFSIFGRIRQKDITDFTRQLATMVQARLPLIRCLEILYRQQRSERFKRIIESILDQVRGGTPLSETMRLYPNQFSVLYVNMLRVGEVSGHMAEILMQLSDYLEKSSQLRRKVLTAMTYPMVIVIVAIAALSFLIFGVMPTFSDMFQGFERQMPLSAKILLDTAAFAQRYIIFILIAMMLLILGFRSYFNTPSGRRLGDILRLSVPLFGNVSRKVAIARFTRTLGTLLMSGVPLMEALDVTGQSMDNSIVTNEIVRMKSFASQGESMELSLTESKIFPLMVSQMIAVGEETAELPDMLLRTAKYYEDETDAAIDALTSVIEPVIILILGVILGGAIITIYRQIFEIMEVVQ